MSDNFKTFQFGMWEIRIYVDGPNCILFTCKKNGKQIMIMKERDTPFKGHYGSAEYSVVKI